MRKWLAFVYLISNEKYSSKMQLNFDLTQLIEDGVYAYQFHKLMPSTEELRVRGTQGIYTFWSDG